MRILLALAVSVVLTGAVHAQTIQQAIVADTPIAGGGAYTGPCDVATCAHAYGLRAMTSAARGTKAANVCNPSDVCADVNSDATTGIVATPTIGGHACTGDDCYIHALYDQITTADLIDTVFSGGDGPKNNLFLHNCIGSLPCVRNASGVQGFYASYTTISQPFTLSTIGYTTAGPASGRLIGSPPTAASELIINVGFDTVTNSLVCGGSPISVTADDTVIRSYVGVCNGASSVLKVDSITETTGNAGSSASGAGVCWGGICTNTGGAANGANKGNQFELEVFASALSSGDRTSLVANQHAFWGY